MNRTRMHCHYLKRPCSCNPKVIPNSISYFLACDAFDMNGERARRERCIIYHLLNMFLLLSTVSDIVELVFLTYEKVFSMYIIICIVL